MSWSTRNLPPRSVLPFTAPLLPPPLARLRQHSPRCHPLQQRPSIRRLSRPAARRGQGGRRKRREGQAQRPQRRCPSVMRTAAAQLGLSLAPPRLPQLRLHSPSTQLSSPLCPPPSPVTRQPFPYRTPLSPWQPVELQPPRPPLPLARPPFLRLHLPLLRPPPRPLLRLHLLDPSLVAGHRL